MRLRTPLTALAITAAAGVGAHALNNAPLQVTTVHNTARVHHAAKRDDVPWCNPRMAKPSRQVGIVWAWAGVHCSADWKEIWWWVEANMYSHAAHDWVNQAITKVHYNGRPTRFHADTAYAHCRWWGYGAGTDHGRNTERNWQTFLRVDGVLSDDPGTKIRMYAHEDTTLHCVGFNAR